MEGCGYPHRLEVRTHTPFPPPLLLLEHIFIHMKGIMVKLTSSREKKKREVIRKSLISLMAGSSLDFVT